jgi:predicted ATPase
VSDFASRLRFVLRGLRLQNFKAWRDTGPIELAPLTVFFGSNSSGKSSLNHFLMMLRQTVRSPDRNSVFDFGDENAAARLGSFRDVVFGHDLDAEVRFTTDWQLPSPMTVRDPRSRKRYTGDRLQFTAAARQPPGRIRSVQSEGFEYRLVSGDETVLSVAMERDERRTNRWRLQAEKYELVRAKGRAWELPKPVQFYGFPSEAAVYFQNSVFLSDLELALEERLETLSYLGPLRSRPERLYNWPRNEPDGVGWQGRDAVQAILAASERTLNWKAKSPRVPFPEVIAQWLTKMGLVHSFSVDEIAPDRDEYEVTVQTTPNSEKVKLTDVGFGISQVLPVVVQAFYARPHSTVMIEQPEIHLHPAVQASLADLFIAAITAREESRPRGVQLIVESHSEHLLRRLQRKIAEREITEKDVALYFCYQGPQGSAIDRLEVDAYGDILNWPPDFFGSELEDVAVQAEVGMQRRLNLKA